MAVHVSHAALPYPIKNARYSFLATFLDADGDPTDPTTPDTEVSQDNGAFADAAEEVSTASGSNGMGLITLTGAETNNSTVGVAFKVASGPKATLATLYPRVLATVGSGTLSAGSAGGGTLGTVLAYDVTGCFIRTTGGTGGGGTGGANNQARKIATYVTSTGAFTVVPNWETTPSTDTTYDVLLPEGVTLGMLRTLNPTTAGRTVNVSAGGVADADMTAVSTDATAADNLETMLDGTGGQTLSLGKLNIVAAAGVDAIVATGGAASGATPAGHGFKLAGGAASTTGGGVSGNAINATGGAGAASTNGAAVAVRAAGGGTNTVASTATAVDLVGTSNGHGLSAAGAGSGEGITAAGGDTGHGIQALGGATSGDGIRGTAQTSGSGLYAEGVGSGSAGIRARSGGSSATGVRVEAGIAAVGAAAAGATPATAALTLTGGAASTSGGGTAAAGLSAIGGAGAASTNGAAVGVSATGGGTTTVAGAAGVSALGTAAGAGVLATGGATGHGLQAVGGSSSGDGIRATVTDGIELRALPTFTVVTNAGSNTASLVKTDRTEAVNDYWKGALAVVRTGALKGQVKKVSAYNGTSKEITFSTAFTGIPADGVVFDLVNQ